MKIGSLAMIALIVMFAAPATMANDLPTIRYCGNGLEEGFPVDIEILSTTEPVIQAPQPVVPEPATIALVGLGLGIGGMVGRRKL